MISGIYNSNNDGTVQGMNGVNAPFGKKEEETVKLLGTKEENTEEEAYKLDFSSSAWEKLNKEEDKLGKKEEKSGKEDGENGKEDEKLSEEDQRKVEELKKIDKEVHAHEQAHLNAAGGYARGGASYDYVTGPDGKRYANGGHVNLDVSPEKEPEQTIRKAEVLQKAALAPAQPSPEDKQIASDAAKMAAEARQQLAAEGR